MKSEHVARANLLVEALAGLAAVEKAMYPTGKPRPTDGDRWAFEIGVHAACNEGGSEIASIEIDLETARLVMPAVRSAIVNTLSDLGVDLPDAVF